MPVFSGFPILGSEEEECVHPVRYFADCVSECRKAGEDDSEARNQYLNF